MRFDELFEMAYSRKKADQIVTGLEKPINRHLLKLMAFDAHEGTRNHWKIELLTWFRDIASIIDKSSKKPFSSKFYFGILFDEPFGGAEVENTRSLLETIIDEAEVKGVHMRRNEKTPDELMLLLKEFHAMMSVRIAAKEFERSLIDDL